MISVLLGAVVAWSIAAFSYALIFRRRSSGRTTITTTCTSLEDLGALDEHHEVLSAFEVLIHEDGAGEWPPQTNHYGWPLALRPYKDIYFELAPHLSTTNPSVDDELNQRRRHQFRSAMRRLLAKHIVIKEVESVMMTAEAGKWNLFQRDAYNGFYCCIAVLRHAYRWATNPVVKVAQLEKFVELPAELDIPWSYLQRNFGITSESGNIMSNVIHNFDRRGELVFRMNIGMSEQITKAEYTFLRLLYDSERLGVPIYCAIISAILAFTKTDRASCLENIQAVSLQLHILLQNYYENMQDSRMAHSVWMRYVQGLLAWGAGRMDGETFIQYHGPSGSHVLIFQAVDAFLGLDQYLSDDIMQRHVPENQRLFCASLRKHSFRRKLGEGPEDAALKVELDSIVKQMRVFRAVHRTRAITYLGVPTPERLHMTSEASVAKGAESHTDVKDFLGPLYIRMANRLNQTV